MWGQEQRRPGPGLCANLLRDGDGSGGGRGCDWRPDPGITGDANALLFGAAPALSSALNLTDRLASANRTLTQTVIGIGAAMAAWFSLKPAAWLLRLLGLGGVSTGMRAAEGVAVRAGGRALGLAARVAGPLGLAYDILHPDALNAGEDADMARNRALNAGRGVTGGAGNLSRADRNNNPGNIMGNGRYLHFATLDEGYAAVIAHGGG
jgi:hypothetical protein